VRLILVGGCLVVGTVLYSRGQLTAPREHPGVVTLLLLGGFLLGVAWNALVTRLRAGRPPSRIVEDLKAFVAVAAAALLAALVWNRVFPAVPPDRIDSLFAPLADAGRLGPENVLAAVVGFYFGSRS
jgi:hypothetical protein